MTWLITGGAGFIGMNVCEKLAARGERIVVMDNFSRLGTRLNLEKMRSWKVRVEELDIRDRGAVENAFARHTDVDVVLHLAGQVAVTLSVKDPRADLEANIIGTFNVLEATRRYAPDALLINAATNKLYGDLSDLRLIESSRRYELADFPGISECRPLSFHSPYGCSKGAAEQYVVDYHRVFGLRTVSLRQSCIYGPYQYGIEDQGWLAWFVLCALKGNCITIYGDGKQVRDVLYVGDLVDAYFRLADSPDAAFLGQAFNIGGGPRHTLSILESLDLLEEMMKNPIARSFQPARTADQKVYISDIRKFQQHLGWAPSVSLETGVGLLIDWMRSNLDRMPQDLGARASKTGP
jgi:CDP-paratose 2-epimerase